mgnify:FL=1
MSSMPRFSVSMSGQKLYRSLLAITAWILPFLGGAFAQQDSITLKGQTFLRGSSFDYSTQPGYDPVTGQVSYLQAQNQIVTSNTGPNGLSGFNVNNFLGANRFYNAGFSGTQAIMANIEAGHVAGSGLGLGGANSPGYTGGHDTLEHVSTYFRSNSNTNSDLQLVDRHATWAGHALGGRTNTANYPNPPVDNQTALMQGIGHGATLPPPGREPPTV